MLKTEFNLMSLDCIKHSTFIEYFHEIIDLLGEPNNDNNEDCIMMSPGSSWGDGKWVDVTCHSRLQTICQHSVNKGISYI